MLRLMSTATPVKIVADQIGTPTAADSVAEVVWALAARPRLSGVFHWADAGVASWYDLAVAISEEASAISLLDRRADVVPITTADYPALAQRPRFSVLNTRSTILATSIAPRHWRDRLRAVLREIANG
jgi:dTDP-4-dehydrorhamnose reductase